MKRLKDDLKARLEKDENFLLKIVGEIGDITRLIRGLMARMDKLEKRLKKCQHTHTN